MTEITHSYSSAACQARRLKLRPGFVGFETDLWCDVYGLASLGQAVRRNSWPGAISGSVGGMETLFLRGVSQPHRAPMVRRS